MGNAPESLPANYAEIGKLQNIETLTGPYMSWTYLNEDTQALYEEYLAEAEKLLAEFDSTADRAAWAEAKNAALKEDKEKVDIINKMVDTNGSDNFMTSYVDFYTSMYGGR